MFPKKNDRPESLKMRMHGFPVKITSKKKKVLMANLPQNGPALRQREGRGRRMFENTKRGSPQNQGCGLKDEPMNRPYDMVNAPVCPGGKSGRGG